MTTAPQSTARKFQHDDELLYQGRYGEWFWSALSSKAQSYIRRPPCPVCSRTPYQSNKFCDCLEQRRKPAGWVNRESLAWQLQAVCQGADLNIFFPHNEHLYNKANAPWREYCPRCFVSGDCKLFAVDSKSVGVFAGELHGARYFRSKTPNGTGLRGRPPKTVSYT